jgi:SAM-dependent methyltransferase
MERRPGFTTDELKARYDVESITEDEWHSYSGHRTASIVARYLPSSKAQSKLLLNAGSGVYQVRILPWEEISVDLFSRPMQSHSRTVCANIEMLPFPAHKFGAVVCVGEVLGYCDPARALAEFARVTEIGGILICDFGSTRSIRHWFTSSYRRAADLIMDSYNGSPERIWVYDPDYILSVLKSSGFEIKRIIGVHTWSALGRKIGTSPRRAVQWQTYLEWLPLPESWADVMTVVAVRSVVGRES